MASCRRFPRDERDFLAVFFRQHANAIDNVIAVEMHHQHLLLRCVGLEKRLTYAHLADVVPNTGIERGDAGGRAKRGLHIPTRRDSWADVFHRRGSEDMTVRRYLIGATGGQRRDKDKNGNASLHAKAR